MKTLISFGILAKVGINGYFDPDIDYVYDDNGTIKNKRSSMYDVFDEIKNEGISVDVDLKAKIRKQIEDHYDSSQSCAVEEIKVKCAEMLEALNAL